MRAADAILFAAVLLMDRVSKVAVPALMDLHESVPVIPGFFHVTYVRNRGGAFGILASWDSPARRLFFIMVSITALALLYSLYRQALSGRSLLLRVSLVLIGAGAAGNLYDRVATGEVVDFFDLFVGRHHWPAFNLADSAISVGACLMAWLFVTGRTEAGPGGRDPYAS